MQSAHVYNVHIITLVRYKGLGVRYSSHFGSSALPPAWRHVASCSCSWWWKKTSGITQFAGYIYIYTDNDIYHIYNIYIFIYKKNIYIYVCWNLCKTPKKNLYQQAFFMDAGFIVGEKGIAEGVCDIGHFAALPKNTQSSGLVGLKNRPFKIGKPRKTHGFYKGYKPPTQWKSFPCWKPKTCFKNYHLGNKTQTSEKKNRSAKEVILNSEKPH